VRGHFLGACRCPRVGLEVPRFLRRSKGSDAMVRYSRQGMCGVSIGLGVRWGVSPATYPHLSPDAPDAVLPFLRQPIPSTPLAPSQAYGCRGGTVRPTSSVSGNSSFDATGAKASELTGCRYGARPIRSFRLTGRLSFDATGARLA
jgi:hypothetical protein